MVYDFLTKNVYLRQAKYLIHPSTGPDPDLSVLGGGAQIGQGLGPLLDPGQSPGGGFWGGEAPPPDGKRFSVFEMPLEGSPL